MKPLGIQEHDKHLHKRANLPPQDDVAYQIGVPVGVFTYRLVIWRMSWFPFGNRPLKLERSFLIFHCSFFIPPVFLCVFASLRLCVDFSPSFSSFPC